MLNAALLRRKLPTPDLSIELITKGRKTDTKMFLCYLNSVADKSMIKEIKRRISKIDIDGILDSNYINEQIKSHKNSLFKTCGTTERPDVVAAKLLEGRAALIVDGTPVVLTMPYIFSESFQSDDDYYLNFWFAAIGRILRYISFFLSISVPAVYTALCVYHPYLLPTSLATSIATARSGIPFPTYIECFLLIFVFEILRETGIRMQQSMGHALSIVGGLVVGQSAVEAGIVSAPMLIAVALSGICGLMVPKLKGVVFYARVGLTIAATIFGLFGYFFGAILLAIRIFSLDSFGVPYTLSLSEFSGQSLKDTVFRAPWWKMIKRPPISHKNKIRQRSDDA
jgi:spore germination protein KA